MKRLWVAVLFLGSALVLFIGTPALSIGPTASALDGMQQSLDGMQQSLDAVQESISNFQWTLLNGRFTDNGDGTVRDNLTGLVWTKNANIWGAQNWSGACDKCNQLADGEGGLSDNSVAGDWRLPNVRELHSLIDYSELLPALPAGHPFLNLPEYGFEAWSSTTLLIDNTQAWFVGFYHGNVDTWDKSGPSYYLPNVWCVRAGK